MKIPTSTIAATATGLALLNAPLPARAQQAVSVAADYQSPTFTLPYAYQKPNLDGVINPDEWRGAVSIDALQTVQREISLRPTRFWLMWDEDHLYVAMRSPLRQGERIVQAERRMDKDYNVVFDDSYEIYLDAQTHSPDGQPVFFQFLSNFSGARWDVMHEPAVGNFRMGWQSGWQPKNRITPDNQWEVELAIPRQSIYRDTPLRDGDVLRGLIARNFKRPWEQNSVEGASSFSVADTYSKWRLSKTAPALHLDEVADVEAKTFGLKLGAFATQDTAKSPGEAKPLRWVFESDGGVRQEGVLATGADKAVSQLALDKPGDEKQPGSYRIRVLQGEATLLDWSALRKFGNRPDFPDSIADKGDMAKVSLQFNPVHDYLRVRGDFIDFDERARIANARVLVQDVTGKTVGETTLSLDELAYVKGTLPLPKMAAGQYKTVLTAYDAAGKEVLTREEPFEKKDFNQFEWWNTKRGNIEKVIAPWTPVKYAEGRFDVWGRGFRAGHAGLPAQIVTQGATLFARPMHLVATLKNGQTIVSQPAALKLVSSQEHRAVALAQSVLGDIAIQTRVTVEFDGMYKIEMTLDPQRAVEIAGLKVVVPLRNEVADYVHATGEGIRSGYDYGFLAKDKTGRVWDSTRVNSQPMQQGSFIPYLWIGNPQSGLAWFADSDRGWVPNDEVPAIELRRNSQSSTDLILNLISENVTLGDARTITFALQPTPVKPMAEGWRMDSWWTGDTFRDYAQVEPQGGSLIFTSIPFTLDVEKSKAMVEAQSKNSTLYNLGVERPSSAVPYFEHIRIGQRFVPEMKDFGDEWETGVSEGFVYGKSFSDFMVHNLSKWSEQTGIEGLYLDNVHPLADANLEAGRGYVLPDGKVQPEYAMFSTREYFLRVRAAFAEQRGHSKFVVHMTNNMIIPWIGAADVAYDGEQHVIYPQMDKDFMDFWSLERLRVDYSKPWGVPVNFMQEYQGAWTAKAFVKAARAYTGAVILHDALPSGNANGLNTPLWVGRERFGIDAKDVEFIPYWQADSGAKTAAPDVYLAVWKRPGKVLIAVVNWGEAKTASLQIDAAKLGLPPDAKWKVWDAEHDTSITRTYMHPELSEVGGLWKSSDQKPLAHRGDLIEVPVERHDYRQLVIETER